MSTKQPGKANKKEKNIQSKDFSYSLRCLLYFANDHLLSIVWDVKTSIQDCGGLMITIICIVKKICLEEPTSLQP